MEQPVRTAEPSTSEPISTTLSPYLLSRDYEDHLDWHENQRRTRPGGGRRLILGALSAVVTAFTLAGTMMRRR